MAFDPTKDFITREEKYLTVMAGNTDIQYPDPITREEHYLAAICDNIAKTNPPTTDGTYVLQVTVADGVPTYSWEAQA